jgi:hypothetical protein
VTERSNRVGYWKFNLNRNADLYPVRVQRDTSCALVPAAMAGQDRLTKSCRNAADGLAEFLGLVVDVS